MAVSKTQVLPLRGNVVDLIQHHNWLLLATNHSEKKNLGIQFLPIVNVQNRIKSDRWIVDTPRPISKFVALPNQSTPPMTLVFKEQSLEPNWVDKVLLQEKVLRKELKKVLQGKGKDAELSVADIQQILEKELKFSKESSEIEKTTMSYLSKIFGDKKAVKELKKHFEKSRESHRFSYKYLPNQRIVCVDDVGCGYHLPYIPSENDFDGDTSGLLLKPFSIQEKIKFIEGYDHHHVILVVEKDDVSEWVYIYNLDDDNVVFEMPAPQAKVAREEQSSEKQEGLTEEAGEEPSEEAEQKEDEAENNPRKITAIAVDVDTKMFGLGFDDCLYLMFKRKKDNSKIDFERLELRDLEQKELTVSSNFEQTGHKGSITGLHFSLSTDNVLYLTAFANDLSMSRLQVAQRIPLKIAESARNRHSKDIRGFVRGPGYFFYSLSWDNTIRMWQTDKNFSKVMSLQATSICVARIPTKDKMGNWSFQEMLFSGHDAAESETGRKDTVEISVRNIDLTDNGVIKESVKKQFFGVWQYASEQMDKEAKFRSELLDYISDFGDQVAVDILIHFVEREGHPPLISKALDLLNATKHPRLPVIFKDLMDIDREATCLQVFEYLRMEHLYGKDSLYPLELANSSYFLKVRQAGLRGYAELAARREAEPTNVVLQTAFERILEIFNEDDEDDIIDNAFHFLFGQEEPFLPGVEGILITVAHRHYWIQERGLKLLYFKNMLQEPETKDAALDLLRQVRDSSNEDLRNTAFLISLTAENAVQTYLRSLDDVVHGKLVDMELEVREDVKESLAQGFDLKDDVIDLFLAAVPEEKREDKNIDMTEAKEIIKAFGQMMGDQIDYYKLGTFGYCIQTFPMAIDVKEYLLAARHDAEFPKPQLDRELELEDEMLLQEMALSYQPSIAALGAMALAKLGRHSALPILLLLVDDEDELVKSRAVDGLLEFIHEPVVEQKLRLLILQAPNEQVKRNSRDKAKAIHEFVERDSFHISHYSVDTIVNMIFEDNVYSHTERLCIRYLFESTEITFSSGSRSSLFKKIRERGEQPKAINIRAKVIRALYKKAEADGESHLQKLLGQTLESPFDDIRVLAVVRLQERIQDLIEANPDWRTQWPRYTEEEWTEFVKLHGGGLISKQDIQNLLVQSDVDPTMSLIGFPKPLLVEIQLLNRVLFWRGHESMAELIKTYVKYNFVNADFIETRRFLLSLPVPEIFEYLLREIDNNVQDTMLKEDSTVENWHASMWDDYLQHEDQDCAREFYATIDTTMRQPRTPEEKKKIEEGSVIPPYVPFLKAVFESKHVSLQETSITEMLEFFNDAWVCDYIQRTFDSSEYSLRQIGVQEKSLRVLHENGLLRDALLYLLKSQHTDMLVKALDILFFPSENKKDPSKDVKIWVEGMIDDSVMEIILSRMSESMSEKSWMTADFVYEHFVNQEIFAQIPKPVLFGRNYEKEYFALLQKLFIYETQADIQDELDAYNRRCKEIDDLLGAYKGKRDFSTSTEQSFSSGEDGLDLSDVYKYIGEGSKVKAIKAYREQTGLGLADAKDAVEELIEKINLLGEEKRILRKPTRRIDNRFFEILKLLAVAKGSWADELLQNYLSNFDEKLSNEAFLVFFTRGVTRGDAELFLKSMIRDNHPRLDDVFGLILSERYGSIRSMKNVLFSCTRLSRIDLVFQAFDALANADLVDDEAWEALLQSSHDFLRYRALQYFVNHDEENVRTKMLEEMYSTFILESCPSRESDLITQKEVKQLLEQKKEGIVHAYIKNGRSLTFSQLESLRKRFPMSPGFIRRIMNSDLHMLVSGLTLEAAQFLLEECQKLNVVIVLSKTNPLYFDETLSLWQDILSSVLVYIQDSVWTTDDVVCDNLLKLERHLEESSDIHYNHDLQRLTVEATGSVAGPANFEQMYTYLGGDYENEVAISLVRSGNVHGMRYLFDEDEETISSMIALGDQAESFVERTLYGALGPELQKHTVQMWLMRLAQVGGKSDLMMTMLSGSEDMMLLSAQLLGDLFDKDVFLQRVIELLKLEKIQLSRIPNDVHFNSIDGWKESMKALRKVYEKHYCVETHSEKLPSLIDLRSAERMMFSEEEKVAKRKEEAKKKNEKVKKEDTAAFQKSKEEYEKLSNAMSTLRVSAEEWKWFAKHLVVSNSRLRCYVAEVLVNMLSGSIDRLEMLEEQEYIQKVLASIENEFAVFQPFSLNGVELTQESAVSFGFGTLAGMVRNQRNLSTPTRRKGLASLMQLAKKHPISTVPAVLSVALNDPSKTVRQDAFSLALVDQDALGLTWEKTIRQAINSVSLRNAQEVTANSDQYDSLNQLIVSELDQANRSDLLLELIRTQPHHLGFVALDLVLNSGTKNQNRIIDGLNAAIESPNETIRRRLIGFIKQALADVYKYNDSILPLMTTDKSLEYLDDGPYWEILVRCLKHGVEHIREDAALYLIKRNKHREATLDFIYSEWLDSMESSKQVKACRALERLSPPDASSKILKRLTHDLTETAHYSALRNTLLKLNQYDSNLSTELIQRLNQEKWVENISDVCFELLVTFSGYINKKIKSSGHQYRVELLCELLDVLRFNSHSHQVETVMNSLLLHPCEVSGQLDQILSDIAINAKSQKLLSLRKACLNVCIYRYHEMTPLLKDISKEKYKEKPTLDKTWEGSNWDALHHAIKLNLNYHPIAANRKEYLSEFQKMSAMALIAVQIDSSEPYLDSSSKTFSKVFSTVRLILEDVQYTLTERANALEALATTESIDLFAPLCRLIGLGNDNVLDESIVLTKTPDLLYNRALSLIGLYHDTDRGTRTDTTSKATSHSEITIVDFLLERLLTSSSSRRPYIIRSLWNFTKYPVHQVDLIKALLQCNTTNKQTWLSETIDVSGYQEGSTTLLVWLEMLMSLYQEQFDKNISPLLAKEAENVRNNILHHLYTTNVNKCYEFYMQYCADETIDLDLKLWMHHTRIFLSRENREKLRERLIAYGDTNTWMSLLLESIEKNIQQSNYESSVEKVFAEVEEERRKRLQRYPNQESQILLCDTRSLQSFLSRNISIPKTELLFAELLKRYDELSEEVVDWIVGVYHQNRMGEFFVFDEKILSSMEPIIWKSEVDTWERDINNATKGAKFYVDLLEQYLEDDSEVLASIFDMLKHRSFEKKEKMSILSVISNLRQEWGVLQVERAKGIRNRDQISQVEQRWLNALPLIPILDMGGNELSEILLESKTSFELKERALDLYLERSPTQEVLQHVYQNYSIFEPKVAPFMTLEGLKNSVMNAVDNGDFGLFKTRLEKWTEKLDSNLKHVENLSKMLWIQENLLVSSDIDAAIIEKFRTAVRSGNLEESKKLLRVKDNRHCVRLSVVYKMIADVLEKNQVLISMYWATVEQGKWLHNVVQHMYSSVKIPSFAFMNNRSYFNEEIYLYTNLINESYRTFLDGDSDLLDSSKVINLFADQHSEIRQKVAEVLQRLFPIGARKDSEELDLDTDPRTGLSEKSLEEWQEIVDNGLVEDISLGAFLQEFEVYDPSLQKEYALYLALATVRDANIREKYAEFAPVYSKYRSWSDKAQRSRSHRFSKELS